MALSSINPVNRGERRSGIEKILDSALKVAQLTNFGVDVVNSIKNSKTDSQKFALEVATKTREAQPGEKPIQGLDTKKYGNRIALAGEQGFTDYDKSVLDFLKQDYRMAQENEKGTIYKVGGKEFNLIKKEDPQLKNRLQSSEDTLRKEFLDQSKEFIQQTSAMSRIEESAKDPTAAGDLALIFNYMKVLDPGSTVREGEFANAENSGGVPDRISAQYNKVLSGERLTPVMRNDFVDRARRMYKGSEGIQKTRENYYTELANNRDVNPGNVIRNLGISISSNPLKPPTSQDVNTIKGIK